MKWTEKINIKFDFDGTKNFIIAEVDESIGVVEYEVNMIENNPSIGNLNLIVSQFDDKIELLYDITGKTALTDIIKRRNLSKEEFVNLIRNILRNLAQFEELMLENGITVLNPDYIYVDEEDFKVTVLYIPVIPDERIKVKNELVAFFNRIYSSNVNLMGEGYTPVINKLLEGIRSDNFEIPKLYKEIEHMSNNSSGNLTQLTAQQPVVNNTDNINVNKNQYPSKSFKNKETIVNEITTENVQVSTNNYPIKVEKEKGSFNGRLFFVIIFQILIIGGSVAFFFLTSFEDIIKLVVILAIFMIDIVVSLLVILLGNKSGSKLGATKEKSSKTGYMKTQKQNYNPGVYETVILGDDNNNNSVDNSRKAFIVDKAKGSSSRYLINKDRFRIGRLVGEVDLLVKNGAVGKLHCEIVKRGDCYYIIDCNSKNGTFINGSRINSGNNVEIKNNDSIRFANSEYEFKVE